LLSKSFRTRMSPKSSAKRSPGRFSITTDHDHAHRAKFRPRSSAPPPAT
jgi:hypothetical protein